MHVPFIKVTVNTFVSKSHTGIYTTVRVSNPLICIIIKDELLLACDEVRSAGEAMGKAASQFALDTSQANRRAIMIHTARELLMSVVRLMAVADDVDMNNLTKASGKVCLCIQLHS